MLFFVIYDGKLKGGKIIRDNFHCFQFSIFTSSDKMINCEFHVDTGFLGPMPIEILWSKKRKKNRKAISAIQIILYMYII